MFDFYDIDLKQTRFYQQAVGEDRLQGIELDAQSLEDVFAV